MECCLQVALRPGELALGPAAETAGLRNGLAEGELRGLTDATHASTDAVGTLVSGSGVLSLLALSILICKYIN